MPTRLLPLVAGVVVVLLTAATAVAVSSDGGDVVESTAPTSTAAPPSSTTTTPLPLFASVATPPPPPPTEPPPPPPTEPPATAAPVPKPKRQAAPPVQAEAAPAGVDGAPCIVRLHGKGGGPGGTEQLGDGVLEVEPGGNAAGWGGRQWLYFPESGYAAARAIVQQSIDEAGCGPVVLYGFSNGGAFAAKLYCRGETFGGRVRGVVIDDPVVDNAVNGCGPARGVRVALYWTGGLEATAQPGWDCGSGDWTCEGGTTIGIDAYQGALGVSRKQSPNSSHAPYWNAPELNAWW
jgi:hypothetical protein